MSTSTINYEEIQQKARCNWCREWLIMSEPISEANLVETGKKWPALYCSRCLAIEFRKNSPKMGFNPVTYDEYYIEDLPDKEQEQAAAAAAPEQTEEAPQT